MLGIVVPLALTVPAVVINAGEGPFLELAFVGTMAIVAMFVYLAYWSLQAEAHSPAAYQASE